MEYIRSSLLKDWTIETKILKKDLPVNPLSHIIFTIDGYNATDETTLAEILAFINKVEVTQMGSTIISLESEDLVAIHTKLFRAHPLLTQNLATDNINRALTLIIPFGRTLFNPSECYPSTKKGELTLSLDLTVPATSFDNAILNIETVELPGASPSAHLKCTQLNVTAPGATGINPVDLPIGNRYVFLVLWNTTVPTTSSHTYGIDNVKLRKDNKEWYVASARGHCLRGEIGTWLQTLPRDIAAFGTVLPAKYFYIDFDPVGNDEFLAETEGASRVQIDLDMGVDEACKISVVELVSL